MIEVSNVSFRFGNEDILANISLRVDRSKIVSILGPSGVGKTTLLRCIAGLLRPWQGKVHVDDMEPDAAAKRQKIGFLFQQDSLLDWRSVSENVSLPFEAAGGRARSGTASADKIARSLKLVGLSDVAHKFPGQLSGGMRQRVALARALAPEPAILLLDEPFAAIDLLTREQIMFELHRILRSSSTPTVFVTHYIEEAVFLSDRMIVLNGRPATIVRTWDVALGRDRDVALLTDQSFLDLVVDVKSYLRSAARNQP